MTKRTMPATVALLVIAGFLGALAYLLARPTPDVGVAATLLESLKAAFLLAIGYYLGSSDGSARKQDTLDQRGPPGSEG